MYCAIIGDIVKSKNISKRQQLQTDLEEVLDYINTKYHSTIAAKFTITLGDEFQGLLNSPEVLMDIVDYIKVHLHPIKVRFGIGFGDMSTEIKSIAIGADGPAYHVAREAINTVKRGDTKHEQSNKDILIYSDSIKDDLYDNLDVVNSILAVCYFIETKWSDKQREIIKHLMEGAKSQTELADLYNIEQSSISRRIERSGYYAYKEAKHEAKKLVIRYWEELNG